VSDFNAKGKTSLG
jgi:hypothetical protein